MLPKGSIRNIIDYFSQEPSFARAMEEALCDFFDVQSLEEVGGLVPSKITYEFFNEWLVFDCRLNSGRTVLEEYLFIHKNRLSREYKNLYTNLILTQHYSLFRIDEVQLDKAIKVTDSLSDKSYIIRERKATREAIVGNYSFCRIANAQGYYEIVSADGFQVNPEALPLKIIKDWKRRKIKFNPLVVYQQILKLL